MYWRPDKMLLTTLVWTLLTVTRSSGSSLTLNQEALSRLYPELLSTAIVPCDCVSTYCDSVYWFRTIFGNGTVQFLGKFNNADVASHGKGVDASRFIFKRKNTVSFVLRIIGVTKEDTGVYSCILKDRKNTEMWKSGSLLLPGVTPPTEPPTTTLKPATSSTCHCSENSSQEGCGSLILWPLVGIIGVLALVLICTLRYFSRLPKKCRHHFVKKRLMT